MGEKEDALVAHLRAEVDRLHSQLEEISRVAVGACDTPVRSIREAVIALRDQRDEARRELAHVRKQLELTRSAPGVSNG